MAQPGSALRRLLGGAVDLKQPSGSREERAARRAEERAAEAAAAAAAAQDGAATEEAAALPQRSGDARPSMSSGQRRSEQRRRAAARGREHAVEVVLVRRSRCGGARHDCSPARVVNWRGDVLCCGAVHSMYRGCPTCGASKPCRDYLRGECDMLNCRFPHPPLDLPPASHKPPAAELVVKLYDRSVMYRPQQAQQAEHGQQAQQSQHPQQAQQVQHLPAVPQQQQAPAAPAAAPIYLPIILPAAPSGGGNEQQVAQLTALMQQVLTRLGPAEAAAVQQQAATVLQQATPQQAAAPGSVQLQAGPVPMQAQPPGQQSAGCQPIMMHQQPAGAAPPQQGGPCMVMLPPHKVQAPAVPTVSPEPPTPTQPAPPPVLQHLFPGRPAPAAVARNAVQPAAVLHQMLPLASPPRAEVAAQPQPRLAAGSGPRRPKAAPVPQSFLCPITQDVMRDPVMANDGHTYERAAIQGWIDHEACAAAAAGRLAAPRSPLTNEPLLSSSLMPNHSLRAAIHEMLERKS